MRKIKNSRDKDLYGELINVNSPAYVKQKEANYNREYSKCFTIFRLTLDDLGTKFNSVDGDPLKLIGQLDQQLLLVQQTETNRYYRLPTKEVVAGFEYTRALEN